MDAVTTTRMATVLKTLAEIEDAVAADLKVRGLPVSVEIIRRRTSDAVALYAAFYPVTPK